MEGLWGKMGRGRKKKWKEDDIESRIKELALVISRPINSPKSLSSAVIFGLISTLLASGSSEIVK
jgi:hypothetical protein